MAQAGGGGQPRVSAVEGAFAPLGEAAERLGYADSDWRRAARELPVRWPSAYLDLAASPDGAPIRRLGIPVPHGPALLLSGLAARRRRPI